MPRGARVVSTRSAISEADCAEERTAPAARRTETASRRVVVRANDQRGVRMAPKCTWHWPCDCRRCAYRTPRLAAGRLHVNASPSKGVVCGQSGRLVRDLRRRHDTRQEVLRKGPGDEVHPPREPGDRDVAVSE